MELQKKRFCSEFSMDFIKKNDIYSPNNNHDNNVCLAY